MGQWFKLRIDQERKVNAGVKRDHGAYGKRGVVFNPEALKGAFVCEPAAVQPELLVLEGELSLPFGDVPGTTNGNKREERRKHKKTIQK